MRRHEPVSGCLLLVLVLLPPPSAVTLVMPLAIGADMSAMLASGCRSATEAIVLGTDVDRVAPVAMTIGIRN